jgi:hypothetical protein
MIATITTAENPVRRVSPPPSSSPPHAAMNVATAASPKIDRALILLMRPPFPHAQTQVRRGLFSQCVRVAHRARTHTDTVPLDGPATRHLKAHLHIPIHASSDREPSIVCRRAALGSKILFAGHRVLLGVVAPPVFGNIGDHDLHDTGDR